jgi:tetratricopeptide (TPR) repeat protein
VYNIVFPKAPNIHEELYFLSLQRENEGDLEGAIEGIQRSVTRNLPSLRALLRAVYLLDKVGQDSEGIILSSRAQPLYPTSEAVREIRRRLIIGRGTRDWAITEAERALSLGIKSPVLAFRVCQAAIETGAGGDLLQRGNATLEAAIEEPSAAAIWRASVTALEGRPEDAIATLREALADILQIDSSLRCFWGWNSPGDHLRTAL